MASENDTFSARCTSKLLLLALIGEKIKQRYRVRKLGAEFSLSEAKEAEIHEKFKM